MDWNLEGKRINGIYLGLFPFKGMVMESRVKYGGQVQHTVALDETIKVFGEVREYILVDTGTGEINRILDEQDDMFDRMTPEEQEDFLHGYEMAKEDTYYGA